MRFEETQLNNSKVVRAAPVQQGLNDSWGWSSSTPLHLCVRKHCWEERIPKLMWSQMDNCKNHTHISLKGHPLIPKWAQLEEKLWTDPATSRAPLCYPSSPLKLPHCSCRSYTSLSPAGLCKIRAEHFSLPLLTSNLSQKGSKKMSTNH